MRRWREWYLQRQITLTTHMAQRWNVWVCGRCGRAVSDQGACICASDLPPLTEKWRDAR